MDARVTSLYIYPDPDAVPQEVESVEVTSAGPTGNRAKKHAVHLVSADEYVATHPKANVVVDVDTDVLASLVGSQVRIGECTLRITKQPTFCPGVYADVVEAGEIAVHDRLLVANAE